VPAPFRVALGPGILGRAALAANRVAVGLRKQLFSYQSFVLARPLPSLSYLFERARTESAARVAALDARRGN
jgi:hypothetical protein